MNVGGIAVLFLVVCAGVLSLVMIAGNANMGAPIDTAGRTVSPQSNATRQAVMDATPAIIPIAGGIALIVALLFIGSIVIYFVSSYSQANFRSRYF
jgi:hypothetical protein